MPSLCLACVIFTLESKEPSANKYLPAFLLWLSQLISIGGLRETDTLRIFIDPASYQYLLTSTVFDLLLPNLGCRADIVEIPRPKTLLEGMLWKYSTMPYDQDQFLYLDIDIFITKSLHSIFDSIPQGHFSAHVEGEISHPNYSNGMDIHSYNPTGPGFSAGKFFFSDKDLHIDFCTHLIGLVNPENSFYTIEQPYFNRTIYELRLPVMSSLFKSPRVSIRGLQYSKESTWLLDFAGEPGDGEAHWINMLDIFCLLHARVL
jgi:hypothetical protein